MSEICLDCLNKILKTNDAETRYVISRDLDLCEQCGQYKRVVVKMRFRFRMKQVLEDLFERPQRRKF